MSCQHQRRLTLSFTTTCRHRIFEKVPAMVISLTGFKQAFKDARQRGPPDLLGTSILDRRQRPV
jgi:hypothetical protein